MESGSQDWEHAGERKCDAVGPKEITDDLKMKQEVEEVQAAQPELVEFKALDVILHRKFSCPRLTPPKHLKASCLLVEIIDFHEGIPKLAYCGEGQREVPRDALLDLLELHVRVLCWRSVHALSHGM